MKNWCLLTLVLLLGLPGCNKKKSENKPARSTKVETKVDLYTISETDYENAYPDGEDDSLEGEEYPEEADDSMNEEYSWIEPSVENAVQTVYFDFDKADIKENQQAILAANVEKLKAALDEAKDAGLTPTIVVEGHACDSAGTKEYNLALSNNRANKIAKQLTSAGIDKKVLKVVGRGVEMPAVVNGKTVTGSREDQWANRRVEFHVINA